MQKNAIIVISGGLDSSTVAYYVKKKLNYSNLEFLFFDYGQRTLKQEEFCVNQIAKQLKAKVKTINLRWLGEISPALLNKIDAKIPKTTKKDLGNIEKEKEKIRKWWVPCRNSLFTFAALAHAESYYLRKKKRYDIFMGIREEGRVPMKDCTPTFLKIINLAANQSTLDEGYKILAPLMKMDKEDVVNLGNKLKIDWRNTYSCYNGGEFKGKVPVHCGYCANCMLRKMAFYWSNKKDTSIYEKITN
ncbi:MAG TPA: 7-cyano-7-deazaguanine synthase [Candidatus Nanoarchaeia archaeon]|nr:7-cyano-7-deazaguanine synthase [Candidatus Nanoarchaeia archaeon]